MSGCGRLLRQLQPEGKESQRMTTEQTIKLDQFLKLKGVASTGGQAKMIIQSGDVEVNNAMEIRRGRKLHQGDRVAVMGETFVVNFEDE